MNFYNLQNLKININYPDIYFSPEYGRACEYSDNAKWELCQYKDLIYVYLKRPIENEGILYYDLITPYGYSGYYYEKEETYKEFLPMFREQAKKINYITEVLKQNPYLNINISEYDIITSKRIYGINISNLNTNNYLKNTNKTNRRMINTAIKNNLQFKMLEYNNKNLKEFLNIYDLTMNNLNSKKYFYFNDNYYSNLNNCFIACVYLNEILCASCIIFKYNTFLHYHIGGSLIEYRKYGCNNFLHYNVINYGIENDFKVYIIGCGLQDGDSLSTFKKKLANKELKYTIYKNILNTEIYDKLTKKLCQNDENCYFPNYRY
jgi:serine/alanine adding enzyme